MRSGRLVHHLMAASEEIPIRLSHIQGRVPQERGGEIKRAARVIDCDLTRTSGHLFTFRCR